MSGERMLDLDAIKARAAAATPGPWEWRYRPYEYSVRLQQVAGAAPALHAVGPAYVMTFRRWGMQQARPHLRDARNDVMVPFDGVMPDAVFIAHARRDVDDLVTEVERLRAALQHALDRLEEFEETHPDHFGEEYTYAPIRAALGSGREKHL